MKDRGRNRETIERKTDRQTDIGWQIVRIIDTDTNKVIERNRDKGTIERENENLEREIEEKEGERKSERKKKRYRERK